MRLAWDKSYTTTVVILAIATAVAVVALVQEDKGKPHLVVGELAQGSAPNFDGKQEWLADLRGKTVLINFWAGWCGPCVKSLPKLAEFTKTMPEEKFELLHISLGFLQEMDEDVLERSPVPVPGRQWFAGIMATVAWDKMSIPAYVLVDEHGIVVKEVPSLTDEFLEQVRNVSCFGAR